MTTINKTFIVNLTKDPEGVLKTLTVDEIAAIIQKANHAYYNKGVPLFTDALFDVIKEFLGELQPNHPVLKHVGAVITKAATNKVKLPYYMGSLDKIKSDEKVLKNWVTKYGGECVVSDKLDGNSGLLVFGPSGSVRLYSRGDGTIGQDITHLLPFLKSPVKMPVVGAGNSVAVRGELIISKKDFAEGGITGANARNTVAGLINAKIPDLKVASLTSFVAYELIEPAGLRIKDQLVYIKTKLGLPCVDYEVYDAVDVVNLSDHLVKRRERSVYEIDGIVVYHNGVHARKTEENPEYAFAFKSIMTMEKAEVTVLKVEWNISKDGIYVPVVVFTPVALDGVMISRAHGFNGKYIKDNSIAPGAVIVIMRSGAVIPYIVETLVKAPKPQMPDAPYVWTKTNVDIKVDTAKSSDETNAELRLKNIEFFFSKVDVVGLSGGILARIVKKGFDTVGKIMNVTQEELLTVDGFKQALAAKIWNALQKQRANLDPYLVMDASNVLGRGIGYKKIKLICDAFPAIVGERYIPTVPELVALKGIEDKTAELFVGNLPKLFEFVDSNGLVLAPQASKASTQGASTSPSAAARVQGKTFVFSGVRDKDLEKFIVDNGGVVGSTVSSKTSLVLVKALDAEGEASSSKVKKAKDLGVPVMVLGDFKKEIAY